MAEIVCANCGHSNPLGSNFCSSCGVVIVPDGNDRTTVMFRPEVDLEAVSESFGLSEPAESPMLLVFRGPKAGSRIALIESTVTAGRHPESHIFLDDVTVSRRHAELVALEDGGYEVRDVGSLNGTYVNRERVERAELRHGDEVQVGKFKLIYHAGPAR